MNKYIVAVTLAALLVGCGNGDSEKTVKLQKEVGELQQEVAALRAELDAERNGPERLLAKAKNEIAIDRLAEAKKTLAGLVNRYPESNQAKDAGVELVGVNQRIEAAEKAKQAEAAKLAAEQERALARLNANLQKRTDEIKGITWFSHKTEPVLDTHMSLYFGTKDGSAAGYPLRMKFHYFADSWLFIGSVTIKADDQIYTLGSMDFERDNGSGSIWEWSDTPVDDMAMLSKIVAAKKVMIRFDGRQYYNDFVLPEAQKNAMKEVMLAWQRYGGKA
ncbi:hypothetical protein J3Q07_16555 [Pseudomonas sp. D4-18]|uniref:hypothetical protein n=1 Tax=Pseudomonas sp. D4-18 TaxID=2817395 RepID=UPI003DA91859